MSLKRPDLLSEETAESPKTAIGKSNQQYHKRMRTLLWIVILILLLSFGTVVTILIGRPELVGLIRQVDLNQTETAIDQTVIALQSTSNMLATSALEQQDQAVELQNTRAAAEYRESLIAGQETEEFVNRISTETAVAVQNAQEATNSALSFQATQAALNAISTQVQTDFQATQTAIAGAIRTAMPTSAPNILMIDAGMINYLETGIWESLPTTPAWAVTSSGRLLAQTSPATLVTRFPMLSDQFTHVTNIIPLTTQANYDVMVGIKDAGEGIGLRIEHEGTSLTRIALYTFEMSEIVNGLDANPGNIIESLDGLEIFASEINVAISVNQSEITAIVNDRPLLSSNLPDALLEGRVGAQIPAGALIQRFSQIVQPE